MSRGDLFFIIGLFLVLSGFCALGYYYATEKINDCTADPIKFGVEKIRANYEADFVYGSITFIKDDVTKGWSFGDLVNISK